MVAGGGKGTAWSDWYFQKASLTAGDRQGMEKRDREEVPLNDWEHRTATGGREKEGVADLGSGGHAGLGHPEAEASRGLPCASRPPNSCVGAPPTVLE